MLARREAQRGAELDQRSHANRPQHLLGPAPRAPPEQAAPVPLEDRQQLRRREVVDAQPDDGVRFGADELGGGGVDAVVAPVVADDGERVEGGLPQERCVSKQTDAAAYPRRPGLPIPQTADEVASLE